MKQWRVYIDCANNGTYLELYTGPTIMIVLSAAFAKHCKVPSDIREVKISKVKNA